MGINIKSPRGRAKIPPIGTTHYASTDEPGTDVGFYCGKRGCAWRVRVPNLGPGGRYKIATLAKEDIGFPEAAKLAREFASDYRAGVKVETDRLRSSAPTVEQCCRDWLSHKQALAGHRSSPTTLRNWRVQTDALGGHFGSDTPIDHVTAKDVLAFDNRPRTRGGGDRAADTINRDVAAAKAILTHGADVNGYTGTRGWAAARKVPQSEVTARRVDADTFEGIALTVEQMRLLLDRIDHPPLHTFTRLLFLTMQRPQALRMADVRDFDARARTLRLRYGKNASKRKSVLTIPLFEEAHALLVALTRSRPGTAPLVPGLNGKRLAQSFQRTPFRRAMTAAGLDPATTLYAVRRGAITHAAESGVLVLLISRMADVSADLILQHYFKPSETLGSFADLAPTKITPLKVVG